MKLLAFCLLLLSSFAVFAGRVEVEVNGMTCGMCVSAITKELSTTEKVENINVSLENKKAWMSEIKGKHISDGEVRAAIKRAGYEPGKVTRR